QSVYDPYHCYPYKPLPARQRIKKGFVYGFLSLTAPHPLHSHSLSDPNPISAQPNIGQWVSHCVSLLVYVMEDDRKMLPLSYGLRNAISLRVPFCDGGVGCISFASVRMHSAAGENQLTTTRVRSVGNVVEVLEERGLIESITNDNLRSACSADHPPLRVYCGFDPTAESLHLGNLLGIIVLSWFQKCGHKPVALIGGATGRIGDPSGKSAERPELDVGTLEKNGVSIQIGGSDQWGNITAGTELIRKILQAEGAYGLTFPLLLKSDGTKFGKSEDGAIWLSPTMLSPYKFYQYFFTVPDSDVVRFLKRLTFLDMKEIDEIEQEMKAPTYLPNSAQRRLAEELTRFVHGQEGLDEAVKATEALKPGSDTTLDWETIGGIAEDVPSCSLSYDEILDTLLIDLSVSTGLLDSKSAARRLLKQGGLYLNNSRVDSEGKRIETHDIMDGKLVRSSRDSHLTLDPLSSMGMIKGMGEMPAPSKRTSN
ncbi:Tyrosine--tRNA ligase, chloroplastic/mitochondrial-like protein, partial [Drosera capensis]